MDIHSHCGKHALGFCSSVLRYCSFEQILKARLTSPLRVGYPIWFINKIIQEVKEQYSKSNQPENK